jgi:Exportin 1-like protein/Importin-beta N-terminal domain
LSAAPVSLSSAHPGKAYKMSLYETTLAAIRSSLHPLTSQEERNGATEFIHRLKDAQECVPIVLGILTTDNENHDDTTRMQAMTILHQWIKGNWNSVSAADQVQLRQTVVGLLGTSVGATPLRALRAKLSSVIACISERQYPQHWPNFLDEMIGIWAALPIDRQEIVIMSIQYLFEDCIDSDFSSSMPSARRQDILSAIQSQLAPLLATAFSFFQYCYTVHTTSANEDERAGAGEMINTTFRMIRPLVVFVKPDRVCLPEHDFAAAAIGLLSSSEVQQEAAELLSTISQHKLPREIFGPIVQKVVGANVTSLPEDVQESIGFQRLYASAVFSLLSLNIKEATSPSFLAIPGAAELLSEHISLMAKLLSQPSRRLAAEVATQWTKIFKEESIGNLPWMKDVCAVVLRGQRLPKYHDQMKSSLPPSLSLT